MKYKNIEDFFKKDKQAIIFSKFRKGESLKIADYLYLLKKFFSEELLEFFFYNFPTSIGVLLRYYYLKFRLKKCEENIIFGKNIEIYNPADIEVKKFSWIDNYVVLDARFGFINIGSRVHIAPNCRIAGGGGVEIGDYVGISENVKIFSHSEIIQKGKKMSGPMVDEKDKGYKSKKIVIKNDAFIGTGSIILPGVTVEEGSVIGANSVVRKDLEPWTIYAGNPLRLVGKRPK